jgi:hypothetical protein
VFTAVVVVVVGVVGVVVGVVVVVKAGLSRLPGTEVRLARIGVRAFRGRRVGPCTRG